MSQHLGRNNNRVYKLVLTGGPCGGKTTGQARLSTFFENLGWKVYRVPETSTILLGGGVKWNELSKDDVYAYQDSLMRTMMQIEDTFFDLASRSSKDCLVICDRGLMDGSAYLDKKDWEIMKEANGWNEVELRDNRYNQIIHMVSAARGAEAFYQTESNSVRYEGVSLARTLDDITSQAWVGHPYYDVIDNSTDFERKVVRMVRAVCDRLGIDVHDRLSNDSRKRKFLVGCLPSEDVWPQHQDFLVVHDYLVTPNCKMQARIRRRGHPEKGDINIVDSGNWTYTHTIRRPEVNEEAPEVRMQVSLREYELLLAQKDMTHYTIYKKRRCFLWKNQYYQMDIYMDPCPPGCKDLIILETYTMNHNPTIELPDFLEINSEITESAKFSMYNLSKRPGGRPKAIRSNSEGDDVTKDGMPRIQPRRSHHSGDSSLMVNKAAINKKYSYNFSSASEMGIDGFSLEELSQENSRDGSQELAMDQDIAIQMNGFYVGTENGHETTKMDEEDSGMNGHV